MNAITSTEALQPHSVEAEQQLLGALLVSDQVWPKVAPVVTADDFFDPVHAEIFTRMSARFTQGHLVDVISMASAMGSEHEGLRELGGGAYLARLAGASVATTLAVEYAKMIVDKHIARKVLAATKAAQDEFGYGGNPQEIVARLQGALMALPETEGHETCVSLLKAGTSAIESAAAAYSGHTTLLKTGLVSLDKVIRGLAPSDLCLLGGASSMGKTSVAVAIAQNVAQAGKVVGFASLEMEPEQLFNRVVSSEARIPYELARATDEMGEENFRKWVDSGKQVAELPVHIFPRHVRDIAAIHATAQSLKMQQGGRLDLLVVDYAQLCRAPGREFRERMVNVSIGLKAIAKMLSVPVIALVQLDRKIGDRPDPRPQTFDIKETSQFETDADQIIFCHWAHYYLIRKGPALNRDGVVTDEARADWEADKRATENRMELIVRKNRHGRLATAEVGCDMPINRFWNLHERMDEMEF
ncbi:MAG: DnaB-like helicase C-terminal domain-containing protein [Pseudomonadota bacterium]